ncbi:uncharacterized protein AB9X84_000801 [Acanthopagrus schlegelii]
MAADESFPPVWCGPDEVQSNGTRIVLICSGTSKSPCNASDPDPCHLWLQHAEERSRICHVRSLRWLQHDSRGWKLCAPNAVAGNPSLPQVSQTCSTTNCCSTHHCCKTPRNAKISTISYVPSFLSSSSYSSTSHNNSGTSYNSKATHA